MLLIFLALQTTLTNKSYCSYARGNVKPRMPIVLTSVLSYLAAFFVQLWLANLESLNLLQRLPREALANPNGDTENHIAGPKHVGSLPVSPTMSRRNVLDAFPLFSRCQPVEAWRSGNERKDAVRSAHEHVRIPVFFANRANPSMHAQLHDCAPRQAHMKVMPALLGNSGHLKLTACST